MAETKNISIPRGSKVTLNFPNVGAEELPGVTMHFTVARAPNSLVKIIGPKTCTVPDEDGSFSCDLSAEETNVTPGKYFYDVRCVVEGAETLLASGICVITGIAELPEAEE